DYLAREFGGGGGNELDNLTFLQYLQAKYPGNAGAIFNDARWINDPTAATTVPAGAANRPTPPNLRGAQRAVSFVSPIAAGAGATALRDIRARRRARGELLKVPWRDGSNAFLVAPWRSA